ncbi:MAG TPA: hypothetical protein VEC37_05665 [Bacillota bacterium]|nr:hypothetical protein [Bacillota bacterium]
MKRYSNIILISLALTLTLFAGCGGGGNNSSTNTSAVPVSPVTIPEGDRYFSNISVDEMKAAAKSLTGSKQTAKAIIIQQVKEHWGVIQSKFGFTDVTKACAFFLGFATRESTLDMGLETPTGQTFKLGENQPSHSYGLLQTAETAYAGAYKDYAPETDVPELTQYQYTPENFYDPGISVHMGIRHLIHFGNQAKANGSKGIDILRYAVLGFNTGHVTGGSADWMKDYVDEMGALAQWYYNGHLTDNTYTWHTDPRAAAYRSSPWDWTGIK